MRDGEIKLERFKKILKEKKGKFYQITLLMVLVLILGTVFISPTPANKTTTNNTLIEVNLSITWNNSDEIISNQDGTNFTSYNNSLGLFMNFDNVSSLGENNNYVVDLSNYSNNEPVPEEENDSVTKFEVLASKNKSINFSEETVEIESMNISDIKISGFVATEEFEVTFNDPKFSKLGDYDLVTIDDTDFTLDIGKPILPMKIVSILVAETNIESIDVNCTEKQEIEGTYNIFPVQEPQPISVIREVTPPQPDPAVYSSSDLYPSTNFEKTGISNIRNNNIFNLVVYPIRYYPSKGKIVFCKKMDIKLNYGLSLQTANSGSEKKHESKEFNEIIESMVINPKKIGELQETPFSMALQSSALANPTYCPGLSDWTETDLNYIIITNTDSFKDEFQRLADWKTKKGVPAKVTTVTDILNSSDLNCDGGDTQEKIKNFIIDVYEMWGIEWVLLGGDTDVIPHRTGYVSTGTKYGDVNIPTDLYYAELDSDWDADDDGIYGEVEDNNDLNPEVFIGRAPVNSLTEVQTFINKILKYEQNPPTDYQLKILLLGAQLDSITQGGDAKDVIDDASIPSKYDPLIKRYENLGNLSVAITTNEMNAGPHIVNHVGHGGTGIIDVNGYFRNADADGLTNSEKYFILYSFSCYSNRFDSDALSEHFINNQNGGAVAYIGNSRYGWYYYGLAGYGPSDEYDKQFFNSLLNENFFNIGQAHADAKIYFLPYSSYWVQKWLQYTLNLLGDPEMPIWTDIPQNLTVTYPSEIPIGQSTFTVTVKNSTNSPVENATVAIQKGGEVYNYSLTDSNGQVTFSINPSTTGEMNVTITKQNFLPYENTTTVSETVAAIITIESPLNQTYNTNSIEFNITVNQPITNAVFSVDNSANSSLTNDTIFHYYNISYPALAAEGGHNATFYVNKSGSTSSVVNFTINFITELEIWDETGIRAYGNQTRYRNERVLFFANYTYWHNGGAITTANCTINFTGLADNMSFNITKQLFEYNKTFSSAGEYNYEITCNYSGVGADNLTSSATVNITSNSNLTIWDGTDNGMPYGSNGGYKDANLKFFANYTNQTSTPLNTSAGCNISFADSLNNNMGYNSSIELYDYNRSFSTVGTYNYNISCSADGYESLIATDNISILYELSAPILNFTDPTPENNLWVNNSWIEVNLTITEETLDTFKFNWDSTNYTFYDNSLVLGFNFNNNSAIGEDSSIVTDISTYGNDGTISGANWTSSGKYRGAFEFNGSGNHIRVGNDASLDITNNLTIEAWIKIQDNATKHFESILVKGNYHLNVFNQKLRFIIGDGINETRDTILNNSNINASFLGEVASDFSSRAVSGVGDVNGDGYDDFIIGAYGNDEGGDGYTAGQTYLILGRANGWEMDANLSNTNASFLGEVANDNSGYAVSGVGDVNTDGYDDFIIGAYYNEEGSNDAGQTYLILGRANGWEMDVSLSNANASFLGEVASDLSSEAVSGVGDVNGDGYDDFIIGARNKPNRDSRGKTYLILGRANGWEMDVSLSNANASFLGEVAYDYSGYAVSGAGDVNADGYDDFIIGAYGNDEGGSSAGQTYLILGRVEGWDVNTILNNSNINASFLGEVANDYSGYAVSGAGDVNADGYDDFIIGAYGTNKSSSDNEGKTYLILGRANGWEMDANLSNTNASFLGEVANDYSGYAVSGAGDVNGDGYSDFIIGAYGNDEGGSSAGQTYLILSSADIAESSTTISSNNWHHVTGTFDGIELNIYVDGVQTGNASRSSSMASTSTNLTIGVFRDMLSGYFNGTIDELRVWNKSLSSDEILLHYQSEFQKYNSTEWKFYNNITNLAGGDHTYYGWANDTAGNTGSSETRSIFVADTNKPYFANYAVNSSIIGLNKLVRFSVDIIDTDLDISYVNGTIGETTYNLTDSGSDEWYYDYNCTSSETVNFTYVGANDTAGNWNSTAITGVSLECDVTVPSITNASINDSSARIVGIVSPLGLLNERIKINASITDTEDNLAVVTLEITPPTIAAYNTTPPPDGSEFYHLISLNETGQWAFKFYANDTAGNEAIPVLAQDIDGNDYINVFVPRGTPTINLISPADNAVDTDANITFDYNVTNDLVVQNCSLMINGMRNQTNSSIVKGVTQTSRLNGLGSGVYRWGVNCTNTINDVNGSETRTLTIIPTTSFAGSTTNLTSVNISNITNFVIDEPSHGRIDFSQVVDLSGGGDLDSHVNISFNRIHINSSALPALNKSATLTIYNLTFTDPQVLRDSEVCPSTICQRVDYAKSGSYGNFTFTVTQFSSYSARETPSSSTATPQPESDGQSSAFAILPSTKQLQEGYEKTLRENDQIEFKFKEENHKLKLDKIIDDKTVQITISSEPITFNLSLNEIKKVNLDADSYYDLKVYLNKLTSYDADVVVKLISEEIPSDVSDEEKVVGSEVGGELKISKGLIKTILVVGGGVIILFVLYLIVKKKRLVIAIKLKSWKEKRRRRKKKFKK